MFTTALRCAKTVQVAGISPWSRSAQHQKVLIQDLFQLRQCSSRHKAYVATKSGPGSCCCATKCFARDLLIILLACWQPGWGMSLRTFLISLQVYRCASTPVKSSTTYTVLAMTTHSRVEVLWHCISGCWLCLTHDQVKLKAAQALASSIVLQ